MERRQKIGNAIDQDDMKERSNIYRPDRPRGRSLFWAHWPPLGTVESLGLYPYKVRVTESESVTLWTVTRTPLQLINKPPCHRSLPLYWQVTQVIQVLYRLLPQSQRFDVYSINFCSGGFKLLPPPGGGIGPNRVFMRHNSHSFPSKESQGVRMDCIRGPQNGDSAARRLRPGSGF